MVCVKCGATLNDGAMFCGYCGAKQTEIPAEPVVESQEQENVLFQEEVISEEIPQEMVQEEMPVAEDTFVQEGEPEVPKKKSSKGKLIAIIAAALVVIGALVFVFWDKVENTVATLMPAEKQLQMAYTNSAEKWSEGTGSWIEQFKAVKTMQEASGEMKLNLEVDETILGMVLPETLSGINKADLAVAYETSEDDMALQLVLGLAGEELLTANGFMDLKDGKVAIQVPDLNKQALEAEFDVDDYQEAMGESNQAIESLQNMMPNEKYAEEILPKYVEILFSVIEEADRTKETIEVGDVSQKVTVITIEIDDDVIDKMGDALLEELKNDEEFEKSMKNIFKEAEDLSGDDIGTFKEFYDEFFDGIKEGFSSLEDTDLVQDGFELVTWINSDNEVIGIQVDEYLKVASARNKDKVAYEFCAMEDGDEIAKVLIEGTEKDEVFEGTITLYSEEEKLITVDVDKFTSTKDNFECVISVDIPDEVITEMVGMSSVPGQVSVKLEMSGNAKGVAVKFGVNLSGEQIIALGFSNELKKDAVKAEYPSDTTDDPMTWASGLDVNALLEKLEKVGITQDVLADLIQDMSSMVY